jgi:uncharacterized protein (DUF305 family)
MTTSRLFPATALAIALSVAAIGAGSAQTTDHQMHPTGSESGQAYMDAMQKMNEDMLAMAMTGDAGVDFATMMIPHHQSAIDMAKAYLELGDDPELTALAKEVISAQQREIAFLERWLEANR